MPTIVQQVEDWYAAHSDRISQFKIQLSIRSLRAPDQKLGKVEIRVETPSILASLAFWNNQNVSALAVDTRSKAEHILDDRPLQPADVIPALLDAYFRKIIELEKPPSSSGDSRTA